MIKPLNYHEGKYRKCYSSYACKYIQIWKQCCPHMITEHTCHRNDMQHTGAEYSCLYIPGLFPRFNHFTILYIRHIGSSFLYDFVILVPSLYNVPPTPSPLLNPKMAQHIRSMINNADNVIHMMFCTFLLLEFRNSLSFGAAIYTPNRLPMPNARSPTRHILPFTLRNSFL